MKDEVIISLQWPKRSGWAPEPASRESGPGESWMSGRPQGSGTRRVGGSWAPLVKSGFGCGRAAAGKGEGGEACLGPLLVSGGARGFVASSCSGACWEMPGTQLSHCCAVAFHPSSFLTTYSSPFSHRPSHPAWSWLNSGRGRRAQLCGQRAAGTGCLLHLWSGRTWQPLAHLKQPEHDVGWPGGSVPGHLSLC